MSSDRYPVMIDIEMRDLLSQKRSRFKGILADAVEAWDPECFVLCGMRPDAELKQVILDEDNFKKVKACSKRYGLSHRAIVEMAVTGLMSKEEESSNE